jgi:cytochrome c oxidase subunit 1
MALVLGAMGGLYYWGPKITGYLLNETIGKVQFWFLFIGTQVFTLPLYLLGLRGMPRRVATYVLHPGWQFLNQVSTVGAILIGISTIAFMVNIVYSWKKYPAGDNPWDGHTLEWFTTSPPPHHNFYRLPQIRSERPTWDYNHPGHTAAEHGHHHEPHDEVPVV